MRVAFIHDWLLGMRGGERCLEVLTELFPDSEIFTLFCDRDRLSEPLKKCVIHEGRGSSWPGVRRYYRHLLPFYPALARDLSGKLRTRHSEKPFDIVLSVSHCAAKNILVPSGVQHVCYCLTPMRYLWDQYDAYFARSRFEPAIRRVVNYLRTWDRRGAKNVDGFIAISEFVRARIQRVYGREAFVVYPPVRQDWIEPRRPGEKGTSFLCVNALVPYKNVELIIDAFNELQEELTIVGSGPESSALKKRARSNIRFCDHVSDAQLALLYRRARALIFAAEEDFGMVPVEVQAAGRPVICYRSGGCLETVLDKPGQETGVFFRELTIDALMVAVKSFMDREGDFTVENCQANARNFDLSRFVDSIDGAMKSIVTKVGSELPATNIGIGPEERTRSYA